MISPPNMSWGYIGSLIMREEMETRLLMSSRGKAWVKTSDVFGFGDTRSSSENMRGDIRLPAEDRLSTLNGNFRERTAESKQLLSQSL
jgi:hypothetical protein